MVYGFALLDLGQPWGVKGNDRERSRVMRDHTKLRVFQLADELALELFLATRAFPVEEKYGLSAHLRKTVLSVVSNLVEGCARRSESEFLRFLDIALGSAREVEYQLGLARRLGFLPDSTLEAKATTIGKRSTPFPNR